MATIAFWGDSLTEGVPGAAYIDVLKKQLPQHTILNYGKGGDTVRSLYTRAVRSRSRKPESLQADAVFLWLGVNDVLPELAAFYPPMKRVVGQPWTRNDSEFSEYYRKLLELFGAHCQQVWAVAPLFIGEDIENYWNRQIESYSRLIKKISGEERFVDMRSVFLKEFSKLGDRRSEIVSQFLPVSPRKAAMDMLFCRRASQADRRAEQRGLFFTMDGVHLNSRGARIVADTFKRVILQAAL